MARETVRTVAGTEDLFQFLREQFQKSACLWGPRRSHEHPLFVDAQRYASLVSEWFHAEEPWFDGRHKALEVHALAGLPNGTSAEAMLEIRGAAVSIGLYQFDIADKLQRAVEALECPIADSRDSTRSTVDSLVKDALVAIDRSINAWLRLKRHRADIPDSVFPLLVQLDHLRRAVDDTFPHARFFVRPSLDPSPTHG